MYFILGKKIVSQIIGFLVNIKSPYIYETDLVLFAKLFHPSVHVAHPASVIRELLSRSSRNKGDSVDFCVGECRDGVVQECSVICLDDREVRDILYIISTADKENATDFTTDNFLCLNFFLEIIEDPCAVSTSEGIHLELLLVLGEQIRI